MSLPPEGNNLHANSTSDLRSLLNVQVTLLR
jgi:hypothetical protein